MQRPMWLVGLLLLASASACATSTVEGFRDPSYAQAHFSKLDVFALAMNLESTVEVENQICKKLKPAPCVPGVSVLPPTRSYAVQEVRKRIKESGADAVLMMGLVSDRSNTQYVGALTESSTNYSGASSGTLNLYGNSANWSGVSSGSSSQTTVSAPIYGYSRVAHTLIELYDATSGHIVWRGEVTTSGKGMLNVTDKAFIASATTKTVSALRSAGLINWN